MRRQAPPAVKLMIRPLTSERWPDLVALFGPNGACGGCWCMWWRLARSRFVKQKGLGNKRALKRLVDSGDSPGLVAYAGKQPVAWCSVGPRDVYPVLDRSRVLKRIDDQPVWSVVCFFVAKSYQRQGITTQLLKAAAAYARKHGASLLEGYPVDPKKGATADVFAYTGFPSAFREAGFVEVARRSPTRPVMRLELKHVPTRGSAGR